MSATYLSADSIREQFSAAMSAMYQKEVPQYGTLLKLVHTINNNILAQPNTEYREEHHRLQVERHGAIRLGTAEELTTINRLFNVLGMYPVGYYDLSTAGVPVHSTAFRPITPAALQANPFRIFTSLLRLELITDNALRQQANKILAKRDIFTTRLRELLTHHETQGGFTADEAAEFVQEALETFRWHEAASVDLATYTELLQQHRLIADVVCFRGPHINHLTPRTLDIDLAQQQMPEYGMNPKEIIEGPPQRQHPILLRQTSFKALNERISFTDNTISQHTARFGEIEQRGMALTPAGRELYDQLLNQVDKSITDNASHQQHLQQVFAAFPDDLDTLRRQKLAYFHYNLANPNLVNNKATNKVFSEPDLTKKAHSTLHHNNLDAWIAAGLVTFTPITYEDFLPVSAAGIFQSNLGDHDSSNIGSGNSNKIAFEQALGRPVIDEFALYQQQQDTSILHVIQMLSI